MVVSLLLAMAAHSLSIQQSPVWAEATTPALAMRVMPLGAERLGRAKHCVAARRIPLSDMHSLIISTTPPAAGDLVLARVERIGPMHSLQLTDGRRAALFVGNEIIAVYGNRSDGAQVDATVPHTLDACELVADAGIAGQMHSQRHGANARTRIVPLGFITDSSGTTLNLERYQLAALPRRSQCPSVIAVVGATVTSGRTSIATWLIRGLVESGLHVGAARVTGTGGDIKLMQEAGASPVLDITDAGLASTCRADPATLERSVRLLMSHLAAAAVDVVVVEFADDLTQRETGMLLTSRQFAPLLTGVVYGESDAMRAKDGVAWLRQHALHALCVASTATMSRAAIRHARDATGLPVLSLNELGSAEIALQLLGAARHQLRDLSERDLRAQSQVLSI